MKGLVGSYMTIDWFFFNPQQPKIFGVKFSLRAIKRIFLIKLRNSKLWKMSKLLNFRLSEGRYF